MPKRRYRAVHVNSINWERLSGQVEGQRIVVGIDVAKTEQFAAMMLHDLSVLLTLKWEQPYEQGDFTALMADLATLAEDFAVVMEPSGVYGGVPMLDDAVELVCDGVTMDIIPR